MKEDVDYLPKEKQVELSKITHIINEITHSEMIVLFGSYARNEWVEDKYDEIHYRYQSDFDILVIVQTNSEAVQSRFEREIEEKIGRDETINTPVSIIVHDINFVNKRLNKAQYFFTDIKKQGILLYNSGKYQLNEAKELSKAERKKLAQEDFDYWFSSANEFWIGFMIFFERGSYSIAAFQLHQVTERLLSGILLVFTRYKPNTHDLGVLKKLVNSVDSRLAQIFPLNNIENQRLFKLLRKAYVDARYKPSYVITKEELTKLSQHVEELKKIGELICREEIESF
ncbi:MAG: HEPN domain-containing protein [Legionella sp.]|uniref:HEPN domain-containing protein n=1 Tax=Legionella sp. TaxID=459 RepID=UPI0039E458F1